MYRVAGQWKSFWHFILISFCRLWIRRRNQVKQLCQEHASSKKRHIFKFQSNGGAWPDKAMNVFVEKYILISRFLAFLEVKVLRKVLIEMSAWLVQIISGLDSQSKFQMFPLFSRPPCWCPLEVHQHGCSLLGSVNLRKLFRRMFKDRKNAQT